MKRKGRRKVVDRPVCSSSIVIVSTHPRVRQQPKGTCKTPCLSCEAPSSRCPPPSVLTHLCPRPANSIHLHQRTHLKVKCLRALARESYLRGDGEVGTLCETLHMAPVLL